MFRGVAPSSPTLYLLMVLATVFTSHRAMPRVLLMLSPTRFHVHYALPGSGLGLRLQLVPCCHPLGGQQRVVIPAACNLLSRVRRYPSELVLLVIVLTCGLRFFIYHMGDVLGQAHLSMCICPGWVVPYLQRIRVLSPIVNSIGMPVCLCMYAMFVAMSSTCDRALC